MLNNPVPGEALENQGYAPGKRTPSTKVLEASGSCSRCGIPLQEEVRWNLHSGLAPDWLQDKWTEKKSRKRKMKDEEQEV